VTSRSVAHARWVSHANGVNPPQEMRHWLTDRTSLTVKLVTRSRQFRVERIRQSQGRILADECAAVLLPRCVQVREREVLLRCDERPVVYAHTIVPLTATASDWPFFNALGERSLGTTLFGDPLVRRRALQYARLKRQHPLVRRACEAVGPENISYPLFARRCLFQRKEGALLVTEVFLPAIADVGFAVKDSSGTDWKELSFAAGELSDKSESRIQAVS
jgi:chorismate--pyruvate lyase